MDSVVTMANNVKFNVSFSYKDIKSHKNIMHIRPVSVLSHQVPGTIGTRDGDVERGTLFSRT